MSLYELINKTGKKHTDIYEHPCMQGYQVKYLKNQKPSGPNSIPTGINFEKFPKKHHTQMHLLK